MSKSGKHGQSKKSFFLLSLAALGVVYGDIGTSPLYTINQIFFGSAKTALARADIFGAISLVLWALTIVVSFKYIIFVLRADNGGEGGVFALYGLLNQVSSKWKFFISGLLIFAAGLLFGDGVITPAISVISAVEGIKIATPAFAAYVVPITLVILTGLFAIQSKGTSKVGIIFGPIIMVWFLCIAVLGFFQIINQPSILLAINPLYGINFLFHTNFHAVLLTLGAVILAITGGEAMYADMGHFGRNPIRLSWFSIVYPSLLLTYLGQGAYLLSGAHVAGGNIFYSMVPTWGILPMVVIATFATIIASQALISGAFSLSTQAITLGLFPYLKTIHTHHQHEGQIYVPFINWALYIGCALIVIVFQSSDRLASAYGLAVSGVMLITSISMVFIAKHYWKWSNLKTFILFIPLSLIDAVFLGSNSLKLLEGGYVPLLVALALLLVMHAWQWGRHSVTAKFKSYPRMKLETLIEMKKNGTHFIPKSAIIMAPQPITDVKSVIPVVEQMHLERNRLIHHDIIFLHVHVSKTSHMHNNRYEIKHFYQDEKKGSIVAATINFGYMEELNVESMLEGLANHHKLEIDSDYSKWNILALHERAVIDDNAPIVDKIRFSIFKLLQNNAETADEYFELGQKQSLSIQVIPVTIG